MPSLRLWVWGLPVLLYAVFWIWYTPLSGPMSQGEIDELVKTLEQRGASPEVIDRFRMFFEDDDGKSFIMVNAMDLADSPAALPATGPGASADALLDHYVEFMWPELLSRACHPLFMGQAFAQSMDVIGIDGAEQWSSVALMRYRSRRDMWQISSHQSFRDRHDYKVAALEKTIAFPVTPQLMFGDLRLILLLLMITVLSLVDTTLLRGRTGRRASV